MKVKIMERISFLFLTWITVTLKSKKENVNLTMYNCFEKLSGVSLPEYTGNPYQPDIFVDMSQDDGGNSYTDDRHI